MKLSIAVEQIEGEDGAEGVVVHTTLLGGVWEAPADIRPGDVATLVLPLDGAGRPFLLLVRDGKSEAAVLERVAEDDAEPGTQAASTA